MTATDDRPTTTCPAWCTGGTDDYPCRGEHYGGSQYVAATGGRPLTCDPDRGARFPVVSVAVMFSEVDGEGVPTIGLAVHPDDKQVGLFKVSEARELIRLLQEAVDAIG